MFKIVNKMGALKGKRWHPYGYPGGASPNFKTKEKAENYLKTIRKKEPVYIKHPEQATPGKHIQIVTHAPKKTVRKPPANPTGISGFTMPRLF